MRTTRIGRMMEGFPDCLDKAHAVLAVEFDKRSAVSVCGIPVLYGHCCQGGWKFRGPLTVAYRVLRLSLTLVIKLANCLAHEKGILTRESPDTANVKIKTALQSV